MADIDLTEIGSNEVADADTNPTVTSVTVASTTPTIQGGANLQLAPVVNGTNSPSQACSFALVAGVGAVSAGGLITAPASASAIQTGTVRVTSVQDTSKYVDVTFSVPAAVVVTPPPPSGSTFTGNTSDAAFVALVMQGVIAALNTAAPAQPVHGSPYDTMRTEAAYNEGHYLQNPATGELTLFDAVGNILETQTVTTQQGGITTRVVTRAE